MIVRSPASSGTGLSRACSSRRSGRTGRRCSTTCGRRFSEVTRTSTTWRAWISSGSRTTRRLSPPPGIIISATRSAARMEHGREPEEGLDPPSRTCLDTRAPRPRTTLGVRRTVFSTWHPRNGELMGCRRLAWVCTKLIDEGEPYDEGFFVEHDRDLADHERARFEVHETTPEFDPAKRRSSMKGSGRRRASSRRTESAPATTSATPWTNLCADRPAPGSRRRRSHHASARGPIHP